MDGGAPSGARPSRVVQEMRRVHLERDGFGGAEVYKQDSVRLSLKINLKNRQRLGPAEMVGNCRTTCCSHFSVGGTGQ